MTFGSLFAGIGGFDLGLERSGMECRWQVENDPACNTVLQRHFPETARYGDIRTVKGDALEPVDLICGGNPCQGLSVAGDRRGLDDDRSGLWYEFWRILTEVEPEWVLFENVPGLFSSNQGRDFAIVLAGLTGQLCEVPEGGWKSAGWARGWYNVCWRVLDSRFFGVAQRRRRVFIAGCLATTGRSPLQVLFEREGVPRHLAQSKAEGEGAANHAAGGAGGTVAFGGNNTSGPLSVATACNAHGSRRYDFESETFAVNAWRSKPDDTGQFHSVTAQPNNNNLLCFRDHGKLEMHDTGPTLTQRDGTGGNNGDIVAQSPEVCGSVRRLTPTECERLQAFPEGWTDGQPDKHRYQQLGNAVTVNVAEWIGRRILLAATGSRAQSAPPPSPDKCSV